VFLPTGAAPPDLPGYDANGFDGERVHWSVRWLYKHFDLDLQQTVSVVGGNIDAMASVLRAAEAEQQRRDAARQAAP
jgi:hypothetical protein